MVNAKRKNMQIVIPMSGFGERFRCAGYDVPKPLIVIDDKPIIAHVIDMFPGETDFIFICNKDHLAEPSYNMEKILKEYCPSGQIVGIAPHKLGPVHAVLQVADLIDKSLPVIVNYCDFTCFWDWNNFKEFVIETECVGAIPAYKGFHPHTLGSTNYAYMQEEKGWILDIQEKQPYTDNRMEEFASSGTYYFDSGQTMLESFQTTIEQDINIGGEFYVSLTYKPILAASRPVAVYDLQHFMQWGTPQDVAEYIGWSKTFRHLAQQDTPSNFSPKGTVIIPMAGLGMRFVNEGYSETKPLIPVSGLPMVIQAAYSLPPAERYVFVLRKDMDGYEQIADLLKQTFDNVVIKELEEVTDGQATTALVGLAALEDEIDGEPQGPITFGACDFGSLYSKDRLQMLMDDCDTDIIVWGMRGNANAIRHPQMFGWIDETGGEIKNISVKVPLDQPESDPIVLGTFTFRSPEVFHAAIERMYKRDGKVNGEFYLDTMVNDAIALGMRCKLFEVDSYLSWGTPNDLRTFEYWQSCFHKWEGHPYRLELDTSIPNSAVTALEEQYNVMIPKKPGAFI
jgi:UTP-glucose-1-phosphate uridylyltransferase